MTTSTIASSRIVSIDIIRGVVMVLMAIDHVRVYAGVPPGGADPAIFFTRWVTHFCAPAFLFLAGTSSFFYARRHSDLSRFLLVRGLWLVLLELTVIRLFWTFNLDFAGYEMAGVIWAIGWCMVIMAALVKLPAGVIGLFGVIVIAGHNLLDPVMNDLVSSSGDDLTSALWKILYVAFYAGPISLGPEGPNLIVLYSIVPWIGVMAAGYAFGMVLTLEPARRDRLSLSLGLAAVAMFVVLRGFNLYGDPWPWSPSAESGMPGFLGFLNTTKYPASLSFLLMTLGPSVAVVPVLERMRGIFFDFLAVFGRVPFFFYLLHILLIHALALGVSFVREGQVNPWLFENHPMSASRPPEGYSWDLMTLYAVWIAVIAILYPLCRWFSGLKSRRSDWWLKYL